MTYESTRNSSSRRAIRYSVGTSAASALALVMAAPAVAQDAGGQAGTNAGAQPENTIIVSGIRGSLQRNLDVKREAPGVVDVISSEEIGKFPDSNVAASLQRLPGVSIQRDGMRGEANGVTIRGFGGDFEILGGIFLGEFRGRFIGREQGLDDFFARGVFRVLIGFRGGIKSLNANDHRAGGMTFSPLQAGVELAILDRSEPGDALIALAAVWHEHDLPGGDRFAIEGHGA